MDTTITLVGTLGADPEAVRAGEHELARFRMAVTRRELRDGRWSDVDTFWMPVEAWHHLGRNVVASLHKGDPVVVTGLLRTSRWTDANQQRHDRMFVTAQHVGHDLVLGSTEFRRTRQPTSDEPTPYRGPGPGDGAGAKDGAGPGVGDADELAGQPVAVAGSGGRDNDGGEREKAA